MPFAETTEQTIKLSKKLTKMMHSMQQSMLLWKTECTKIRKCAEFVPVSSASLIIL